MTVGRTSVICAIAASEVKCVSVTKVPPTPTRSPVGNQIADDRLVGHDLLGNDRLPRGRRCRAIHHAGRDPVAEQDDLTQDGRVGSSEAFGPGASEPSVLPTVRSTTIPTVRIRRRELGLAKTRKIDHVAIAVDDLGAAWRLFGETLGGRFVSGGDDTEIGIRVLQVAFPPGMKVELIEPLDDASYVQGFLDRRGPGFHHLTMLVDDVVAVDTELTAAGFETTDLDLRDPRWRETYVRPRSGFGTLIQLTDSQIDWGEVQTHITPEQVIAGEVLWVGTETPRLRTAEDGPPPPRGRSDAAPGRFGRD